MPWASVPPSPCSPLLTGSTPLSALLLPAPSRLVAPNRTAHFLAVLCFCLSLSLCMRRSLSLGCRRPLISPPGPASQLLKPSAEAAGTSLSWPPVLRAGASQHPLQDSTFLLNDSKQVCWRSSLAHPASPTDQDALPLSTWPGTLQTHELEIRKLL